MRGHTDKATINQRLGLTPLMVKTLRYVGRYPAVANSTMDLPEKNAARALHDRGMITWLNESREWAITDGGRAAIRERDL
jgi:hypothetical protein